MGVVALKMKQKSLNNEMRVGLHKGRPVGRRGGEAPPPVAPNCAADQDPCGKYPTLMAPWPRILPLSSGRIVSDPAMAARIAWAFVAADLLEMRWSASCNASYAAHIKTLDPRSWTSLRDPKDINLGIMPFLGILSPRRGIERREGNSKACRGRIPTGEVAL